MLGHEVRDPLGIEVRLVWSRPACLTWHRTRARQAASRAAGVLTLDQAPVTGYEIHAGSLQDRDSNARCTAR
jgi:cobyric acid synthase